VSPAKIKTENLDIVQRPWLSNKMWQTGTVKSTTKSSIIFITVFTTIWCSISFQFLFHEDIIDKISRGNYFVSIAYIFPLIGFFLIAYLIYKILQNFKYGKSEFIINHETGVIGGDLSGIVELKPLLKSNDMVKVELSCVRMTKSGSGSSRGIREKIEWQDSYHVYVIPSPVNRATIAIPVIFELPDSVKQTQKISSGEINWRLKVMAKTPGIDYEETFDVPVFKTDVELKSSDFMDGVIVDKIDLEPNVEFYKDIFVGDDRNGNRVYKFPMFRQKKAISYVIFFWPISIGVFCAFAGAELYFISELISSPNNSIVMYMFAFIWPLFVLIVFIVAVATTCWSLNLLFYKSMLVIDNGILILNNGLFGRKQVDLKASEIDDITVESNFQSNNKMYHKIFLQTLAGKSYVAACRLEKNMADKIVEDIYNHM